MTSHFHSISVVFLICVFKYVYVLQRSNPSGRPLLRNCEVQWSDRLRDATGETVIVESVGPTLLGRNWLTKIRLDWRKIHQVDTICAPSLESVATGEIPAVFQEGLGTLVGFKPKVYVDPTAKPKFHRARSVPYALREMVDQELQRLQQEGTCEPVEMSEWAAPIVAVLKQDKKHVRICGDFRLTVNPASKPDKYLIPKVADLFSQLSQGKYFTKIDLSQAYQQLPLDEESMKYVVINTHRGLFRYTRLPFGISSAPGIFQRVIESLLQGIKGVAVYRGAQRTNIYRHWKRF